MKKITFCIFFIMFISTLKSQVQREFNKDSVILKYKVYTIPINAIKYIDLSNTTIVFDTTQEEYINIKKMIVKSTYINIENSAFFVRVLPCFSSVGEELCPVSYVGLWKNYNEEAGLPNSCFKNPLHFKISQLSKKEQKYWVRKLKQTPKLKIHSKASFQELKEYPFLKELLE